MTEKERALWSEFLKSGKAEDYIEFCKEKYRPDKYRPDTEN